MKKGDAARAAVADVIVKAFSDIGGYVGTQDKKIYVNMKDGTGGEVCQFAISLTMPKTTITAGAAPVSNSNEGAWSNDATNQASPQGQRAAASMELSDEDRQKVQELMKSLGL